MKSILDRTVDSTLLRDSLNEISEHLGSTTRNPLSVSLLCIDLGITEDERNKLMIEFRMLLSEHLDSMNEDEILSVFKNTLIDILGMDSDAIGTDVIIGLITGFAKTYIPELYATAMLLQEY